MRQGTTLDQSPGNLRKIRQARNMLASILAEGLQRGFYGEVGLKLVIQDGIVQQVRRQVDQTEK